MSPRSTSTSTVRTAAATTARRRKTTRRILEDLLWRLDDLSDEHLVATIGVLVEELETRRTATHL
jgi:hypothetical protein